ncbi:MAG: MBL fold metallo-hydrolase [Chloroflexia bacterium]|nr:MBL fold metallo-hydrolase [Chloroflexia bacterium]
MVELTFLGTGTSNGIPVIGCDCAVCHSHDPRDRRTRTSVRLRQGATTLLIDTAPELRGQMLASDTRRVDAVLYTHAHADHTAGLDDLRRFCEMQQQHIPVFATPATGSDLRARFAYAFADLFPFYGATPDLTLHEIDRPFAVANIAVTPVPVLHASLPIVGFRVGALAYVTDAKTVPAASMPLLRDLDILVLNALRQRPHPAHLSLDEALAIVAELRPRRAYLTHIAHEMGRHVEVEPALPAGVALAYDGLSVTVCDDRVDADTESDRTIGR